MAEYVEITIKESELKQILELIDRYIERSDNIWEIEELFGLKKILKEYSSEPFNQREFLKSFSQFVFEESDTEERNEAMEDKYIDKFFRWRQNERNISK